MGNLFYKITSFIEKIGKHNIMLGLFVFVIILVMGFYQTFSIYTSSEEEVIDGVVTYNFTFYDTTPSSVIVPPASDKKFLINIENDSDINLKYALYYESEDSLNDVYIGFIPSAHYESASGTINAKNSKVISIEISNKTDFNVEIEFGVIYGTATGGELEKDSSQYWLEEKTKLLSDAEVGSYVSYLGNNGCETGSCYGISSNGFKNDGFRIAYFNENTTYLVSAGAPEVMCTNDDGTTSNSKCESFEEIEWAPLHLDNLDKVAAKYCNTIYAYSGICNENSVWSIDDGDFKILTNKELSMQSCYNQKQGFGCGYDNDLIDIGNHYWYAIPNYEAVADYNVFAWNAKDRVFRMYPSNTVAGVRPILRLDKDVEVVGGEGTSTNPYRIAITGINKINDKSGTGNHGINVNANLDEKKSIINVNGNKNAYVDLGFVNYDFTNNISVALKFKPTMIVGDKVNYIMGNYNNLTGNKGFSFSVNPSGYLECILNINNKPINITTNAKIDNNKWYTVVMTYDGVSAKIYINGESVKVSDNAITEGTITSSNYPIMLGGSPLVNNNKYLGINYIGENTYIEAIFDDVLIYNRAIGSTEIVKGFKDKINIIDDNKLLLHYTFD